MPRKRTSDRDEPTGRSKGKPVPTEVWTKFLECLAESPDVSRACSIVKVSRPAAYDKQRTDPEFAEKWAIAWKRGWDAVEEEALRRAKEGVDRPVFQGGRKVGVVREYSDGLLQFLLKGNKKSIYAERTENLNANLDLKDAMSEEDLNKLLAEKFQTVLPATAKKGEE